MEKNDLRSLGISLILNLLIIFFIPGISKSVVNTAKISVGFVELKDENRKISPKKTEKKPTEKTIPQTKQKIVEKKENLQPSKKIENNPLKIENPSFEIDSFLVTDNSLTERTVQIKKNIKNNVSAPLVKNIEKAEMIEGEINGEEKLVEVEVKKIESIIDEEDITGEFSGKETGENMDFSLLSPESDKIEGLPKGHKMGFADGDISAKWDSSNREPIYPKASLEKGVAGSVKLKMNIGPDGKVNSLVVEKGSGIPDINRAVEEIGRTWKIYLTKNGLSVEGTVLLEYKFNLIRGE
jgi:protein TonB